MAPAKRRRSEVVIPLSASSSGAAAVASGSSSPAGCGYESPTEDSHTAYMAGGNESARAGEGQAEAPTPQGEGIEPATPTAAVISTPLSADRPSMRPTFSPRPSYMVAPNSPDGTFGAQVSSKLEQPSLDDMLSNAEKLGVRDDKVSLLDRLACYQWTFFTMTMATGGVANSIHSMQFHSDWLTGVGLFFFIFNIVLFFTNCTCICVRFYLRPGSFIHSFTDQVESLFIPSFFVSIAIILINICEYGIPHAGVWLLRTMEVMFWVYVALSVFASAGLYLILWSTLIFPVHTMTPTWVFPAYPLLLTAPFAANLFAAASQSGHALSLNTTAIALCAATTQGTGCLIAFMISAAFVYRLMTQKLPRDMQRPGVFISIGPFGFTAAGIAHLGSQAATILSPNFLGVPQSPDIIKVLCVLVSLWLWGLAMWFFLVSVGSLWKYVRIGSHLPFQMTWWSFVFPNTALVTATEVMGDIFESKGLQLFGAVMTAMLIVVWIGVFLTMLHCLKKRLLLWPKTSV